MTSTFHISLTAKTAHCIGADLGVWAGRVGSAGFAMRGAYRAADGDRRGLPDHQS